MPPPPYLIHMDTQTIKRGQTLDVYYSHVDGDGNPVSLQGATLLFTMKDVETDNVQSDSTAKIKKTITDYYSGLDSEGNTVSLLANQYYFRLEYADTYQLPGDYYCSFVVINQFGGRGVPVELQLTIDEHATNRVS